MAILITAKNFHKLQKISVVMSIVIQLFCGMKLSQIRTAHEIHKHLMHAQLSGFTVI